MATTELGKELRRLRIDGDERLLDMAERIDKSPAFLSAVETGKKSPPAGFEELVIGAYRLVGEAASKLKRAADLSRRSFTLEGDTSLQRDTFGLMARRVHTLSEDELNRILSILKTGEGKDE